MKQYIKKDDVRDIIRNLPPELWVDYILELDGPYVDEDLEEALDNHVNLNKLAEDVETKIRYMCNCENCITIIKEVILGERHPGDSLCEKCQMKYSCDSYMQLKENKKMKQIVCDRCGKVVKKHGLFKRNCDRPYDIAVEQKLIKWGRRRKCYELCFDCAEELVAWLEENKNEP